MAENRLSLSHGVERVDIHHLHPVDLFSEASQVHIVPSNFSFPTEISHDAHPTFGKK